MFSRLVASSVEPSSEPKMMSSWTPSVLPRSSSLYSNPPAAVTNPAGFPGVAKYAPSKMSTPRAGQVRLVDEGVSMAVKVTRDGETTPLLQKVLHTVAITFGFQSNCFEITATCSGNSMKMLITATAAGPDKKGFNLINLQCMNPLEWHLSTKELSCVKTVAFDTENATIEIELQDTSKSGAVISGIGDHWTSKIGGIAPLSPRTVDVTVDNLQCVEVVPHLAALVTDVAKELLASTVFCKGHMSCTATLEPAGDPARTTAAASGDGDDPTVSTLRMFGRAILSPRSFDPSTWTTLIPRVVADKLDVLYNIEHEELIVNIPRSAKNAYVHLWDCKSAGPVDQSTQQLVPAPAVEETLAAPAAPQKRRWLFF